MRVIGLTGGIGTGKSQVSSILRELGAQVIDADRLGHDVYQPSGEAWREVVDAFGDEVLTSNGEVDRKKLGAIVFADPEALERLNAITHPRIFSRLTERLELERERRTEVVVVEAALLIEANWTPLVDEVWVVTSKPDQVVQRLSARNELDEKAVRSRVRSQMPQAQLVRRADVTIDNSGGLEELEERVKALWRSRVLAEVGSS